MSQEEQILRLQSLFRGNSRVIGLASADLVDEKDGKKNQTRRGFAKGPATAVHWQRHLDGVESLGLVPLTDLQEVKFMAIDVDLDIMEDIKVTLVSLCAKIEELAMPFVVCRSKSGAAHLFVFFKDNVAVVPVRKALLKLAEYLGLSTTTRPVEIFPHSNRIETDSNGKYINLPYFNANDTVRYALSATGSRLSLDEFISLAESKVSTATAFCAWKPPVSQDDAILEIIANGPPCLQTIYEEGIQDGTKNDILMQFGILCKKANKNNFEDMVEIINLTRCDTPHDAHDLGNTIKSLRRKTYHYTCAHPCMAPRCAKTLCMTRKYGIKPVVEFPLIKEIIQWGASDEYFEIVFDKSEKLKEEVKVKILAASLLDFRLVQGALLQSLHLVLAQPKQHEWNEFVLGLMAKVRRVEVPKEFNVEASIKSLIIQYATSRTLGTKIEDLLVKKPVKQGDRVIIRHKDLQAEIIKQRYPGYIDGLEFSVVQQDLLGEITVMEVMGEKFAVFSIPDPKLDTEAMVEAVATDFTPKY